jgi:uncharacterized protein YgbK (DUF1537 family)
MSLLLGCIADDFTGAADLANVLVRGGMRLVQSLGVPESTDLPAEADAVVIALKTRSAPVDEAVEASLRALRWLREAGARRFVLKYSSTFDSGERGNIGPVAEALMDALGVGQTVFCPAFPEVGRTVYLGHLFVHGRPLNESGMEHHPLHPMTDANLVRVLQRQAKRRAGVLPYDVVDKGPDAISAALHELNGGGVGLVIVDVLCERHLRDLGQAVSGMALVTGGSGVALGLPDAYRARGDLPARPHVPELPRVDGRSAVLSGSCSQATQRQVAKYAQRRPAIALDPRILMESGIESVVKNVLESAVGAIENGPIMVYSTACADDVLAHQRRFGRDNVARAIERAMARIARALVGMGIRRLVVAGGETAGAVVDGLGVRALRIGPQIEPGVPWTETIGEPAMALALKSGNFGSDEFFENALAMLP